MGKGAVVVVGGTSGLGREFAQLYADRGDEVVISGRDAARAQSIAGEIGGKTRGIALDLARPHDIVHADPRRPRGAATRLRLEVDVP